MKIAILSGKGGAGKTMTAVNLAAAAPDAVYVDCDVEEPNGRLFIKPNDVKEEKVYTEIPEFDGEKCTGCRKCADFCRFNALVYIREKPKLFPDICHSCGGCALVCPEDAISNIKKEVGHIEWGKHNNINAVTGILNPGQASGIPVIKKAIQKASEFGGLCIIDCPPGSACSVMESISMSDYCIIVVEPTAFGFHNFKMVYELVTILGKKCGIIINKIDVPYEPLYNFCEKNHIDILCEIPYKKELAEIISNGDIICEYIPEYKEMFSDILKRIGGEIQ